MHNNIKTIYEVQITPKKHPQRFFFKHQYMIHVFFPTFVFTIKSPGKLMKDEKFNLISTNLIPRENLFGFLCELLRIYFLSHSFLRKKFFEMRY